MPAQKLSHLSHTVDTPNILSIDINRSCNRFTNMIHVNRRDSQRICYRVKSWREWRRGRPTHGSEDSEESRWRRNT